jgi:antitoxin (DNA-binding transcriptional repressor) of toxin-antitoxin stability system
VRVRRQVAQDAVIVRIGEQIVRVAKQGHLLVIANRSQMIADVVPTQVERLTHHTERANRAAEFAMVGCDQEAAAVEPKPGYRSAVG